MMDRHQKKIPTVRSNFNYDRKLAGFIGTSIEAIIEKI